MTRPRALAICEEFARKIFGPWIQRHTEAT
jgi:hypothetical protein